MDEFTRGAIIKISSTPKDVDGNLVFPATVTAYIKYVSDSDAGRTTISLDLILSATDGPYVADWDTSQVADLLPGLCYGSIRGTTPSTAEDFEFEILANPANPGD